MDEPRIDFLEDEQVEVEEAPEVEATEAPPETVAMPEPPAPEAPTAPEPKEEHVPLAALKAERAKRQEYEARLRQYEQQQQPAPNFHEAPDQYVHHLLQQHEQQVTARMLGALEAQAREVYPDYDELFEVVQQHASDNPVIVQQVLNAPNPAIAVYQLGRKLRELESMKDPDAYRKQIESEIRAQIKAEAEAERVAKEKAAAAIPPDLTGARASKDDDVQPDDSLDSILKSKR